MSKDIIPADYDGEMLAIGSYVKYDDKTWEVIDHEDTSGKYWDDDYEEHADLLLACRSHDDENVWVADYEVEQTDKQQLYFEL